MQDIMLLVPFLVKRMEEPPMGLLYMEETRHCSKKIIYHREGAIGHSVCFREFLEISTRHQSYSVFGSCGSQVLAGEEGCKAKIHPVDLIIARI